MTPAYATLDPFTLIIRVYHSEEDALKDSIKLNQKSSNHPTFLLFKSEKKGHLEMVGRLCRRFGTDDFYWDREGE